MSESASRQYQTQQIMTASPAMLVFMLLDKAVVCLREAIRAIEAGEVEARWKANARAGEIIAHLKSTLDHARGGQISANLDRLYDFMLSLLPKVDFNNDAKAAQSVIDLLMPLRESWRTLASKPDIAQAAAAAVAALPAAPSAVAAPKPAAPVAPAPQPQRRIALSA
ncbi:MAG TPA: flagellar export chaperone FliS [Alphaproteobacteria bacterium]|jgi:flagellar protein FliS|nr:flagellar export chaperone FliS [Alphaproteobacteria bacterium]